MRTDDREMSPASLEEYIDWIISERLMISREEYESYSRLIHTLLNIEFIWTIPMDSNRASGGLALRKDFTYETGLYLDGSSGIMPKCTVFEMLVALAYRCESQLMLDFSKGYRVSRWYYIMLENLGLKDLTNDKWKRDDSDYIYEMVENFMNHKYKKNGTGGLFVIKSRKIDMREEEIWKQLMAFLNENYIKKV